jgi:DNA helicase-2/ATP-dependent DNA helicase PcrA
MAISDAILQAFPELNDDQREAIGLTEGPLLVIAGPGSGKTFVLVLRTLNLLLQGLSDPGGILLCTFTEKAAFELLDRLSLLARKLKYQGDLSQMHVGTIHGIANEFLLRYRHRTGLGSNYEVLDELTQLLFIFDNFEKIIELNENGKYFGRWNTRWTAIQGARNYFNKITEELIDQAVFQTSDDPFVRALGKSYSAYVEKLFETNRIDFAFQQKLFLDLIENPEVGQEIKSKIRYVMVDEYQDTNYVQEQMLLRLAQEGSNIAVVGDEDQALYRFRGATVRNILEFPKRFGNCHTVTLSVNYRSHKDIIEAYNKFMQAWEWDEPASERRFRFEKEIVPDPESSYPDYPALFCIWGEKKEDEARRLADLIVFLKEGKVIEDESQVALLLHSVRQDHSGPYLQALSDRGINAFCPRARSYFDNDEVRYMVACFAILLGYYGDGRGEVAGRALKNLATYVDFCLTDLGRRYPDPHPLAKHLQEFTWEIANLKEKQTLNRRLADYFYQLLAHEPFPEFVKNENRARNLAIFSQLLNVFQTYYHYTVITAKNREPLRLHFFHSFLRLLFDGGINEFEDPDEPMPKGYVQVMTIHQAKGLEFPVVVVGSLAVQLSSPKDIDRVLGRFYDRLPFEPENRITGFDRMRLHYVAFSRAQKILALTATEQPKPYFFPVWQGLAQWPYVQQNLLKSLFFRLRKRMPVRKTFSFTSDLKVYETCPRQYQFFRLYQFTPARSAEYFFGTLVHQTIEEMHRWAMDGKADSLDEARIGEFFQFNYQNLLIRGLRPIGPKQREEAFSQVLNYYKQNRSEFHRIIETEVDVSVEKEDYILTGKVDLLLGGDGKLELLDFKSQPRPEDNDKRLVSYYQQLCIYAHILETRDGNRPDRLLLYWTGEHKKEHAIMSFPYRPDIVEQAGTHFDEVVKCILNRQFRISSPPDRKVCKECDLRILCKNKGDIQ